MRQFEIAFGAARIETDKWFPLLFRFLLWCNETAWLLLHRLWDLWDNEGRVRRHCHLDRSCTLIEMSISRNTSLASDELDWKSNRHLVVLMHVIAVGEDSPWGWWVMLQWDCCRCAQDNLRRPSRRGEVRVLGMHVGLVGYVYACHLWSSLRLHAVCHLRSGNRGVVRGKLMIRHWRAWVHGAVRWGRVLLVL